MSEVHNTITLVIKLHVPKSYYIPCIFRYTLTIIRQLKTVTSVQHLLHLSSSRVVEYHLDIPSTILTGK